MRRLTVICFLLAFCHPAGGLLAQNGGQLLNVRDAGAVTCAQFQAIYTEDGQEGQQVALLQWIAGYATAAARVNGVVDVFPLQDSVQLVQMVSLVCGENTEARLEEAVRVTVLRLQPFWVRGSGEVLTLTWEGQQVLYFQASVLPLKQALAGLGASLSADGTYNNETGATLQQLARQYGLPEAPFPTGTILYVLTRPQG